MHSVLSNSTAAISCLVLAACASSPTHAVKSAARLATLVARADLVFEEGVVHKPVVTEDPDLAFQLAPIFVREWRPTDRSASTSSSEFAPSPTVYVHRSTTFIHGRAHDQLSYLWMWPTLPDAKLRTNWSGRAVRLTVNSAGYPVICEVLIPENQFRLVFVSKSLEEAAGRQFRTSLPQRRFAVEQSVAEQPQVQVVRVVDDGPIPMGPVIHLEASRGEITTIVCRCMPVQVSRVATGQNYSLLPLSAFVTESPTAADTTVLGMILNPSMKDCPQAILRLPDEF